MKTYLISYDLVSAQYFNYSKLIVAIKTFSYWAKPLESVWFIKTENTSSQIIEYLRQFININDKILVIHVDNNWTSLRLDSNVVKWMQGGL